MAEEPTTPNNQAEREQSAISATQEKLEEALKAIDQGEATPDQHALVAGFEAGAQAHAEMTGDETSENRTVEDRTLSDDLLRDVNTKITNDQASINVKKAFGEDTSPKEVELQGDKDLKAYLEGRPEETDESSLEEEPKAWGNPYSELSMEELLDQWAEAENFGDKTKSMNIQDVIQDKLLAEQSLTEEHKLELIETAHNEMEKRRAMLSETEINDDGETPPTPEGDKPPVSPESTGTEESSEEPLEEQPAGGEEPPVPPEVEGAEEEASEAEANEQTQVEQEQSTERSVQEDDELRLVGGKATDILKEIDRLAAEISDRDRSAWKDLRGWRKITGLTRSILRHNTVVELETKRRIASNLYQNLLESAREAGRREISFEDLERLIAEQGLTPISNQEALMLESIADGTFGPGDALGRRLSGEGAGESPEIAGLRGDIKAQVLGFVEQYVTEGLTDEQRQNLLEQYNTDISGVIAEFIRTNPDSFSEEALTIYANNARELLTRSVAMSRHEDGMARLDSALDTMRIDIGERQIGASNNMDTRYLERTIELQQRRGVGRTILRNSSIAAVWLATTTVSAGAVAWASQSASSRGAAIAATSVATVLGGPVGFIAAATISAGASAVWARHMARRNQIRDEELRGVTSAYSTERANNDQGYRPPTFSEASESLRPFMRLRDGVDPDTASDRDLIVRDDLSPDELQAYARLLAGIQARLDVEAEYNEQASNLAEEEQAQNAGFRGTIRSAFRAQSARSRAQALFRATDRGSYLDEQTTLLRLVDTSAAGLAATYPEASITVSVPVEGGVPRVSTIPISEFMMSELASQAISINQNDVEQLEYQAERRITQAGRRGAAVGFAFGVAGFAVGNLGVNKARELLAGHDPRTAIASGIGSKKAPEQVAAMAVAKGSHKSNGVIDVVTQRNYGKSAVDIKGNNLQITGVDGKKFNVPIGADGTISKADTTRLASEGITVNSEKHTRKVLGLAEYLRENGGKKAPKVTDWLDNYTARNDGTELGLGVSTNSKGDVIWSQDLGVARGDGMTYDLAKEAQSGSVSIRFVSDGVSISRPAVMQDGHLVAVFSKGDPLRDALFTQNGTFRGDYVQTVISAPGKTMSVATEISLGQGTTVVDGTAIQLGFTPKPGVVPIAPTVPVVPFADIPTVSVTPLQKLGSQYTTPTQEESATPPEPEQSNTSPVTATPLPSNDIVDNLVELRPTGSRISIDGREMEITSIDDNGNMVLRDGDSIVNVTADELRGDLDSGTVRFERFLGASNPEAIVDTIQDGEEFYDYELNSRVRVSRNRSGSGFSYVRLDNSGNEIEPQEGLNLTYMRVGLVDRIRRGLIAPIGRGVELLQRQPV